MFPSVVGGIIVWLILGIVSSLKLQWNEEDALGGRQERTDLRVKVENFFLSNGCSFLMHRRWGEVQMKQLSEGATKDA